MKKSLAFLFAAVVAGAASVTSAQVRPYGHGGGLSITANAPGSGYGALGSAMPSGTGLGETAPLFVTPNGSSASRRPSFVDPTLSLGTYGGAMSDGIGLGYTAPSPLNPAQAGPMTSPLSPTTHYPLVNCYAGGCSGADGTQYARGAGNVLFGSNGKVCQYTAPGAPLVCN